jgi:hypothetical protein
VEVVVIEEDKVVMVVDHLVEVIWEVVAMYNNPVLLWVVDMVVIKEVMEEEEVVVEVLMLVVVVGAVAVVA